MTLFTKCEKSVEGKLSDVFFRLLGPKAGHFDEGAFDRAIRSGNFASPNQLSSPIICIPGEELKPIGESQVTFSVRGCQRLSPVSKLALGTDVQSKSTDWLVEKVGSNLRMFYTCK